MLVLEVILILDMSEKQFVNCQKAIEGIVAGTPNHDYYKSSSTVIERLKILNLVLMHLIYSKKE